MRLAWLTDIHLNFIEPAQLKEFAESVKQQADAVVLSGDIAESPEVAMYLRSLEELLQRPIYFVLGNHDFYRGSIVKTRLRVCETVKQSMFLKYLTTSGVIELTPKTGLIGHDSWADGRLGDLAKSDVMLNDQRLIEEFQPAFNGEVLDKWKLKQILMSLGDEAARHFETVLGEAVKKYPNVIAVTHVPPFRAAAWNQGRVADSNYLPHFACKAVGDVMSRIMRANPESKLLVLCGHTHGGGEVSVQENLRVLTGEAEYGYLTLHGPLEIE